MPLPDRLARFNRVVTNPLARLVAGRVPPLAIVEHVGRRSGRRYRTPVLAFADGDRWVISLTYGPDRDWVRNVLAARELAVVQRGRTVRLVDPVMRPGPSAAVPAVVRRVLGWLDVDRELVATRRE